MNVPAPTKRAYPGSGDVSNSVVRKPFAPAVSGTPNSWRLSLILGLQSVSGVSVDHRSDASLLLPAGVRARKRTDDLRWW